MKAKINNQLFKYEREREDLRERTDRTVSEEARFHTVSEIVRVLRELRN